MTIKLIDNSFVHNVNNGLNIKINAAKIFTLFQAEVLPSQNNCTRGTLNEKFN